MQASSARRCWEKRYRFEKYFSNNSSDIFGKTETVTKASEQKGPDTNMKFSQISKEQLASLTLEQKWNVNCGGISDDGKSGDVALLLGGAPIRAKERALAAAELYRQGRVRYIVPSGGVKWDVDGEIISECDYMTRILLSHGVPQEAIIEENEATTTKENMLYGAIRINRTLRLDHIEHVVIVTSVTHMKRSLALANALLPRKLSISAYPSYPEMSREEWLANPENQRTLTKVILLMKDLVDYRIVEDMEFEL